MKIKRKNTHNVYKSYEIYSLLFDSVSFLFKNRRMKQSIKTQFSQLAVELKKKRDIVTYFDCVFFDYYNPRFKIF